MAVHGLYMRVILTTYKCWDDPLRIWVGWAQEFAFPVSPPKGFKERSLSKHHCVNASHAGWIVIIWHQPKQSAKKRRINKNCHAFALFDPNWLKNNLVIQDLTMFCFFGFPCRVQKGWHNPGGRGVFKKNALHTCIKVQNAKSSKPMHNSSQQTSTNINHQCHQIQSVNQSVQSINESVFSKLQEI